MSKPRQQSMATQQISLPECAGRVWRMKANAVRIMRLFSVFAVLIPLSIVVAGGSLAFAQTPAKAIAASNYVSCAISASDDLYCWGQYGSGVGDGVHSPSEGSAVPVRVAGGHKWKSISVGANEACGQLLSGEVYCWGAYGGDDNPYYPNTGVPVKATGLSAGVRSVAAGSDHACAVESDGTVFCWGDNGYRQLGRGSDGSKLNRPTRVEGLPEPARSVTAGTAHTCVLTESDRAYCWGSNLEGQFGNGATSFDLSITPVQVSALGGDASEIYAGVAATCVLTRSGGVKCWGENTTMSFLGVPTSNGKAVTVPTDVPGRTSGVRSVSWHHLTACFVLTTGSVTCTAGSLPTPLGLELPTTAVAVHGYGSACALSQQGNVQCWGKTIGGALGNGETSDSKIYRLPSDLVGFGSVLTSLTEYHHSALDYYFVTSRSSEKTILDRLADWTRTGTNITVARYSVSGGASVSRYYFDRIAKSESRGSHFYTNLTTEKDALFALNPTNANVPRLPQNEGIDAWALTATSGFCRNGVPVYRLFRGQTNFPDNPNHRFTADKAVYDDFVSRGWTGEGVAFCAWP